MEKPINKVEEIAQSIIDGLSFSDASIIQDNILPFLVDEQFYRCRMPNQKEKIEAEDRKNRLYGKLLTEGGYFTKKQLKHLLKTKQNIDIDILEEEKNKLLNNLHENYLKLAPKLNDEVEIITALKKEIEFYRNEHMKIAFEISNLLSASIEDRLEKEYIEYLTYLCTEKLNENGSWSKVWVNYEDFQSKNSKLENKAVEYLIYLFLNTKN